MDDEEEICFSGHFRAHPRSFGHIRLGNRGGRCFALAFAMIHEAPDKDRILLEIYKALKLGGNQAPYKSVCDEEDGEGLIWLVTAAGQRRTY